MRFLALCVLKSLFRLKRVGPLPPESGPYIVAANHESYIDPVALQLAVGKRRIHYMMYASYYYTRLLNRFCTSMRCIPVEEEGANRTSLRIALEVLRAGRPIGIFPQGRRADPGDVSGAMAGVAFLVRKTGAPVIPAGIIGTGRALPVGAWLPRPVQVTVRLGDPIAFDLSGEDRNGLEEITRRIMASITALLPPPTDR